MCLYQNEALRVLRLEERPQLIEEMHFSSNNSFLEISQEEMLI